MCVGYKFINMFLEPCYTSTYKLHANEFEMTNTITQIMAETYRTMVQMTRPENSGTYSVAINFAKADETVSEEISLTDLPDFISAVGGNLGLFIGFSFLPVLLKATEVIRNIKIINK